MSCNRTNHPSWLMSPSWTCPCCYVGEINFFTGICPGCGIGIAGYWMKQRSVGQTVTREAQRPRHGRQPRQRAWGTCCVVQTDTNTEPGGRDNRGTQDTNR